MDEVFSRSASLQAKVRGREAVGGAPPGPALLRQCGPGRGLLLLLLQQPQAPPRSFSPTVSVSVPNQCPQPPDAPADSTLPYLRFPG